MGFTRCRALQGHVRFEASCQEWTVLIEDKNLRARHTAYRIGRRHRGHGGIGAYEGIQVTK